MKAVTTGPAIEGCLDEWEELALAFCKGSEAEARDLGRYLDLRKAQAEAEARIAPATTAFEAAKSALATASADVVAKATYKKTTPAFLLSLLLVIGGVVICVMLASSGIAVSILGLVWLASDHSRYQGILKAARKVRAECEASVANANSALESIRSEQSRIKSELNAIQPRKSVRAVGRVYFPAVVATINSQPVAVDQSGASPERRFRLADFNFDSVELHQLVSKIDELRNPPILLTPDELPPEGGSRMHDLHGEERELRDTVETFSTFVGRIPVTEVSLSLAANTTSIAAELAQGASPTELFPGAILRDGRPTERARAVEKLNATLGASKARGVGPKVELLHAYQNIAALLEQYRSLRTTSMAAVHKQFMDAMSRSSWCNIRYYCPKASRNPTWILNRLGVDIEYAHEAVQADVMDRLLGDEEIASRIAEEPLLIKHLEQAWRGLQNVRHDIELHRQAAQGSATSIGVAQSPTSATMSGALRYLQSQQEQYISEYRIALNKVIFGQRTPLLELSSQPKLTYDPETEVWSNETTGTEYADLDEIACSRVLRIHEELLHPIWRHLWTEKADFRRSELFRTNESMLRMNEKESEKLIAIGNQYRDDMRSTREVLKQVESELDGKVQQLRGTREALLQLGLLSSDQARLLSDDALHNLSGGGAGVLQRAEEKETLLALEPQAQTERRELAVDPIDVIANPSNLFEESPAEQFRRKLLPVEDVVPQPTPSSRRLADDHGEGP